MLEYWSGQLNEYKFPRNVDFATNMDTDLYEFAKVVDYILSGCFFVLMNKCLLIFKVKNNHIEYSL